MINVCIIGLGLMGGSLGMSLRRVKRRGRRLFRVSGWGRSRVRLAKAKRAGAVDFFSTSAPDVIPLADIVVLATPVSLMEPLTLKIRSLFKKGAILTDVGSVKSGIMWPIKKCLRSRPDVNIVGAHPLAGSEKTGLTNAHADLFKGSICVLTPNGAHPTSVRRLQTVWSYAGARCVSLSAQSHDQMLAITSHLPHLMSFSLFALLMKHKHKNPLIDSMAAGSFRDMTRIAASDAKIWWGILSMNRNEIRSAWRDFSAEVNRLLSLPPQKLQDRLAMISSAKIQWTKN